MFPLLLLGTGLLMPHATHGITLFSTGDPAANTTAPTGDLAGSGWELQGRWGGFLGTPIAPNLFVTAGHVGGTVGQTFHFQGVDYPTIARFDDPHSDLRIWKVCGIFPVHAELYTLPDELLKGVVVFGRGTRRGAEVTAASPTGPVLKGWIWGTGDGLQRWGTNVISGIVPQGDTVGDLLSAAFDANGGADEAHLSSGDSGGGAFIRMGNTWKLAGIHYAVDGPFNTSTNGGGFNAAIFDTGGLYDKPDGQTWTFNTDLPVNQPSAFYSTRISSNLTWIRSVLEQHSVSSYPPVLQMTSDLEVPFQDHPSFTVDEFSRTIFFPAPTESVFIRLRGCDAFEITDLNSGSAVWELHYLP